MGTPGGGRWPRVSPGVTRGRHLVESGAAAAAPPQLLIFSLESEVRVGCVRRQLRGCVVSVVHLCDVILYYVLGLMSFSHATLYVLGLVFTLLQQCTVPD